MKLAGGVLAMTLVVRDEEETLPANLDYHLSQGVDVVLVIDHGSRDGTRDILAEYARSGRVRWFRDERPVHLQAPRVNRLLRLAVDEHGAGWVIHGDADEFWMPAAGSLRDVFAAVPDDYGYLRVARHNFLPTPGADAPFHQRMVVRHRESLNLRGTILEPKVAQRPAAGRSVMPGNHDLVQPAMPVAPDIGAVAVLHFQMRTFSQFERKVIRNGVGHESNPDRLEGIGCDQLELLAMHRRGDLRGYYEVELLDAAQLAAGLESGELVLDSRLQRYLGRPRVCAESRSEVRELLRSAWTRCAEAAHAVSVADDRAAALGARLDVVSAEHDREVGQLLAELGRAHADARSFAGALEAVRSSKVMRYTATARRAYYKLGRNGTASP